MQQFQELWGKFSGKFLHRPESLKAQMSLESDIVQPTAEIKPRQCAEIRELVLVVVTGIVVNVQRLDPVTKPQNDLIQIP